MDVHGAFQVFPNAKVWFIIQLKAKHKEMVGLRVPGTFICIYIYIHIIIFIYTYTVYIYIHILYYIYILYSCVHIYGLSRLHCSQLRLPPVLRTKASFEEDLVTNMTYADQMHEALGFSWWFYRKGVFTNHFRYLKWRNPHLYKLYVRENPPQKWPSIRFRKPSILGTWNFWWCFVSFPIKYEVVFFRRKGRAQQSTGPLPPFIGMRQPGEFISKELQSSAMNVPTFFVFCFQDRPKCFFFELFLFQRFFLGIEVPKKFLAPKRGWNSSIDSKHD